MERDSITKRFKDRPWILKSKMWTPKRSTIEVEAGLDEDVGALIAMLSMMSEPDQYEKEMIRQFHKSLRDRWHARLAEEHARREKEDR